MGSREQVSGADITTSIWACNSFLIFRDAVTEQFRKRGKRIPSWNVHLFRSSKQVVSDLVQFFRTICRRKCAIVVQFIGL